MKRSSSTTPLLAIGLALAALVGADMLGWIPGRSDPDAVQADSKLARYIQASSDHAADRALMAQAAQWRSAAEDAQSRWDEASRRLVVAPTVELAETRLRELVLAALSDLKLVSPRTSYLREPVADANARLRPISVRLEFDTRSHRDAYIAIDRVRNLPDTQVRITAISIDGPGRPQLPEQLTVSITLRAVAVTGGAT